MKLKIQMVIAALCVVTISGIRVSFPRIENFDSKAEFSTLLVKSYRPHVAINRITQKLDHFNKSDARTWQMRYLSNDKYFADGGPIFIFLQGTGEVSSHWIVNGHFHDIAARSHGYLVTSEHRYFGDSIPTYDLSVPNLQYLSINQSLTDVAHLIRTLKTEIPKLANAKVIMAGGAYGGSMVVWFKRLYPELVDGSWASSPPLLAKANFYEQSEVVGAAFRVLGSQQCFDRIRNGFSEMEQMLANNRTTEVVALFNICNDFDGNDELDVGTLFITTTAAFTHILMSGNVNMISDTCNAIMHASDNISGVAEVFLRAHNGSTCVDHVSFNGTISQMNNITDLSRMERQWAYLSCNEFGWYQTSESRHQPFGTKAPFSLYVAACAELYGNQYRNSLIEDNTIKTNELFGGSNPNVEKVYMTYGEFDPWRPVGPAYVSAIISRASQSSDLGSITKADSPDVKASKRRIARLIRKWLSENP